MFWTFIFSFDILATFPNIGQNFVQYLGHSDQLVLENVIKFKFVEIHKIFGKQIESKTSPARGGRFFWWQQNVEENLKNLHILDDTQTLRNGLSSKLLSFFKFEDFRFSSLRNFN